MVCADTNVWIAYLAGDDAPDVEALSLSLRFSRVRMAPPVLTELLSIPDIPESHRKALEELPQLHLSGGFWARAGQLRCDMIRNKRRPKLADTLIAQLCIDHQMPLLTRDRDFHSFIEHGLKLAQ